MSGSSGRNGGAGIPALGIGAEAADVFRPSPDGTLPTARMVIDGEDHPARTRMLIADLPGQGLGLGCGQRTYRRPSAWRKRDR